MTDFQNGSPAPRGASRHARIFSRLVMIATAPVLGGCAGAVVGGGAAVRGAVLRALQQLLPVVEDNADRCRQFFELLQAQRAPQRAPPPR